MNRRRPSPATVLSLIALFVALGGTTYAAATIGSGQVKNNSLRSKDIRNGAVKNIDIARNTIRSTKIRNGQVRSSDLRNFGVLTNDIGPGAITGDKLAPNAVDGAKIADNAVSGADVNEGSLGQVPTAGNALQLGGRDPDSFESASRTIRLGLVRLSDGDSRELARVGPLTFTGTCDLDNGGNDIATIAVTTTLDNSATDPGDDDLDVGQTANIVSTSITANNPVFNEPDESAAAAPDGTIVGGTPLFAGVNVLNSDCVVGGTLTLG